MSARFGRMQKATALVPLALLSAAWTVSIASVGGGSAGAADPDLRLPDGTTVPAQAIEAPASVSDPAAVGGSPLGGSPTTILGTASAAGIPAAALAAYQRAEAVINKADPACNLPWQLVAAIGRVESNHGRANGNTLDDSGLAVPGIYGVPLDGSAGVQAIADTDGGSYDQDTAWDRAVGPMQFIPSTWSVVGVDADGDGLRNPQDINDAALASAVYLCSGDDDLSTQGGREAAAFRYNHSQTYVSTVLGVMHAYMSGDFTSIPTSTVAASYFSPDPAYAGKQAEKAESRPGKKAPSKPTPGTKVGTPTGPATPPAPTQPPAPAGTPQAPAPGGSKPSGPGPQPSLPVPSSSLALPSTGVAPVDAVLSQAEAVAQCTLDLGLNKVPALLQDLSLDRLLATLGLAEEFAACVQGYTQ